MTFLVSPVKTPGQEKLHHLQQMLHDLKSCAIAYSGGMDSTFLSKVTYDVLGGNSLAVTVTSSTYPARELEDAKQYAKEIGIPHLVIHSEELEIPQFSENPPDRCYFCKKELFQKIQRIAQQHHLNAVLDGSNADDRSDYRPGDRARSELGIRSPLQEVGLTKQEIRNLSASLHLTSAEKPAFACLASRFPYGVKITKERLGQVASAEEYLFSLGIRQCRVRYHNEIARIEVNREDIPFLLTNTEKVIKKFKTLGFIYITVDLEGYRTGSLNEVLNQ
ncbi:MAG: ATP-dependent sacrificial sulfur transferase LarE [Candidatus Thermoplasmatota archaeon]|nr:ATP-dependent sacrificial sulfur transferase LarE [Candidatus Thermoplasmatota archaeon]